MSVLSFRDCVACPRKCHVNRLLGEKGFCGASATVKIGRYGLHVWEEPCISGTNGSGTVFFSHCNMKCIFCQNFKISTQESGKEISEKELADIFLELQNMGAHNINLVTPTHFVHSIIKALDMAKCNGLKIPVIYNTSGYEDTEVLRALNGYIDLYMPDFKYWRNDFAKQYSLSPDYPDIVKKAIDEMAKQVLPMKFDGDIMTRGIIVRHLLLPGHLYDARKIVEYLYNTYEDSIYISLMSQYTPLPQVAEHPTLKNKVRKEEYESLCNFALKLGIKNAFTQEGESAEESFIPDFY